MNKRMRGAAAVLLVCVLAFTACSNPGGGGDPPKTAAPGEVMTRTVSGKEIRFRYVPSGKFQRDGAAANVTVITKGYWLSETEVTQELFHAVMGVGKTTQPNMSGNMWEWVWDWYGGTDGPSRTIGESGAVTDWAGPASGAERVIRGGYWLLDASYRAAARRSHNLSTFVTRECGFRVLAAAR
ncbi:MAG: formylglycine-generating enzyme family protein [Treponema sp.]|nr:formylglycine-generating enzyme family protein [Treponema sp.]